MYRHLCANCANVIAPYVVLLTLTVSPTLAQENREISGNPVLAGSPVVSAELYNLQNQNDTFYNPSVLRIDEELVMYVQVGAPGCPPNQIPGLVYRDQIVAFTAPWTAAGVVGTLVPYATSGPITEADMAASRITPCTPNVAYGTGRAFQRPGPQGYAIVIDAADVVWEGADAHDEFWKVQLGLSSDGKNWTFQPFVNSQPSGQWIFDVTLTPDLDQPEPETWWGVFRSGQGEHVGRMEVTFGPQFPTGFEVRILSGGVFKTLDVDTQTGEYSFSFIPDDIMPNSGIVWTNDIYAENGQYRLWYSGPPTSTGCGCQYKGGSQLFYRVIDRNYLGPEVPLASDVRCMPSLNAVGRLAPARIKGPSGRNLLYSVDNTHCAELQDPQSPYNTNPFIGMSIVVTELGDREAVIGEVGSVTVTHVPKTVNLSRTYSNPVVLAQPPSFNGSQAAVVRITEVTSDSFELFVHEPPNLDGTHVTETVSYLVVESGSWELADGTRLEAGHLNTAASVGRGVGNTWAQVSFANSLGTSGPVVLSQVQTDNDLHFVKTRQRNANGAGFQVALEQDDLASGAHGLETIGWVAFEPGQGSWSGHPYAAANTADAVTHNWLTINFGASVGSAARFLAALATYDGGDASALRYRSLTGSSVEVKVEEDTTWDSETSHTTEVVSYLALGTSGTLNADPVPFGRCLPSSDTLCLQNNRFGVEMDWFNPLNGQSGSGQAVVHPASDIGGFFTFSGTENLEVVVKVIDGEAINGNFWIFYGGMTTLHYTLTVTDTDTGVVRTYQNTAGDLCGDADIGAFPKLTADGDVLADAFAALASDALPSKAPGSCTPGPNHACLLGDRFRVEVKRSGLVQPALELSKQSGVFSFTNGSPDNPEVVVKMVDGTPVNGRYWVFYGSLTSQDYQVVVTDTVTSAVRTYNPPAPHCGEADTLAF